MYMIVDDSYLYNYESDEEYMVPGPDPLGSSSSSSSSSGQTNVSMHCTVICVKLTT